MKVSNVQIIKIDLGKRSYSVYIGPGLLSKFGKIAAEYKIPHRLAIITDTNVAKLHLDDFTRQVKQSGFDSIDIIIPPGEKQKSLHTANTICTELLRADFGRDTVLVAFGGGVVGDIAGFAASTFRRGISFIQIPTTLLGQAESSIGGKTAVNHPLAKNAIGAFYHPKFVISDTRFLTTLPRREIICGIGEIIKYAILDVKIFKLVDKHLDKIFLYDLDMVQKIVFLCNAHKAKLIAIDERELNLTGGRMVLNLGHTIGHAIENLSNYKLHHGEAVLVGLRWELKIAREAHLIPEHEFRQIETLLDRIPFKPKLNFINEKVITRLLFGRNKKIKFVLPERIGKVVITEKLDSSFIQSVLNRLIK